MNAGASYAREVEVGTFGVGRLKTGRFRLNLRIQCMHLCQTLVPELVKVDRAWVDALVCLQLIQREIKVQWHCESPFLAQ